ncbi:MAG: hypothetical protein A2Y73_08205 [Chloroflexi bacterium RBG_13_56_8]|nr:MAG: hypothetical protein A2Y73_08205 [Chloroflexi bacterium RBG_13_56_8]
MERFQDYGRRDQSSNVLLIALVALLIVAASLCGGVYFLFRNGTFDALLGRESSNEPTQAMTATNAPLIEPSASPHPTAPLLITATPGLFATKPSPTQDPMLALSATLPPTPYPMPSATPTPPNPLAGKYLVEYLGCEKHGSGVGTVKGRILDRQGNVIMGAEVRVTLNGWPYDTPGRSNEAGWYEFYLDNDLKVKIVSLRIQGQEMPLIGNEDQEFESQGGCFEYVNLLQQ